MRRKIGPILVGLGVFLLVAAALMRFYAYPALAVAPDDQNSVTKLAAEGATVFDSDPEVLETFTTDLTAVSRTVSDVEATKDAPDGVLIYTGTTSVTDADGVVRTRSAERIAFDEVSGAGVDCCDTFEETEEGKAEVVTRKGQILKFPFNTQKEDYDFWDGDLKDSAPAKYEGEEEVKGLDTYKFVQTIPETEVGTRWVPGSILGSEESTVEANVLYRNTRTMWVDPVTGAIIDRTEDQHSQLEYEGELLTTTEAVLEYTDEQVQENVDEYSGKAFLLSGMRGTFPIVALLLGLILIVAGVLLARRRDEGAAESSAHRGESVTLNK
ncbi:PorA family protein [Nocardioides pacificus]